MSEQIEILNTLKKLRQYLIERGCKYDPSLDSEIKRLEDLTYLPFTEM
jgi:hypothetical protein